MIERIRNTVLFVLYQCTVVLGIIAMPIALLLQRLGLTLPFHHLVRNMRHVYETR